MRKKSVSIVILCCAFALALGLAACGGSSSSASNASSASGSASSASASSSSEDAAKAEYDHACELFDQGKFYSAKAAFENSQYKDWEERAAACVQPMPETGELYRNDNMRSDNMKLQFIVNSSDENVGRYITVYTKDNELAAAVFIKGAESWEMWFLPGEYYIKDSQGTEWYGEDEQFGPNGHYENMVFNEVEGDPYLTSLETGNIWAITINAPESGGQGVSSEDTSWEDRA